MWRLQCYHRHMTKRSEMPPEVRERRRAEVRAYQSRPGIKEKIRAYNKAYQQRPEVIARRNELARQKRATPEGRARGNSAALLYYRRHRKEILAELRRRRKEEPGFAKRQSQQSGVSNRKLRSKIMDALGRICACCGETTPEFLTIDHIRGGGRQHRLRVKSQHSMYVDIIKRGIPKDEFRTLCMNCNFAYGHWGRCPHNGN
jgi:hypothetical protein